MHELTAEEHADMHEAMAKAHRYLRARCAARGAGFERQADLLMFTMLAQTLTDTLCTSPPDSAAALANVCNERLAGAPWQLTRRAAN